MRHPSRGTLSAVFGLWLASTAGSAAVPQPARVLQLRFDDVRIPRTGGERVELHFRLLDEVSATVPLDSDALKIHQDGQAIPAGNVELSRFDDDGAAGLALVLAVDRSLLLGPEAAVVRDALIRFAERLGAADLVGLVAVGTSIQPIVSVSNDHPALQRALSSLAAQAPAPRPLLDAVHTAATSVRAPDAARRAVILISRGALAAGGREASEVVELCRRSGARGPVQVFSLTLAELGEVDLAPLTQLARETGGDVLLSDTALHLGSLLDAIAAQLRRAYVASFEAEADGELHEIQIDTGGQRAGLSIAYPAGERRMLTPVASLALLAIAAGGFASLRRPRHGRLVLERGPRAGEVIRLRPGILRIGSLRDNDIVIPSAAVSRHHAELRVNQSGVELEDLHSRNGTTVNGETVRVRPLYPGDRIRIVDAEMRFER